MFLKKELKHETEAVNKNIIDKNLTDWPEYADLIDITKFDTKSEIYKTHIEKNLNSKVNNW